MKLSAPTEYLSVFKPTTRTQWDLLTPLALLGGVAYSAQGVTSLAVGATALALLPALWLMVSRRPQPAVEPAG